MLFFSFPQDIKALKKDLKLAHEKLENTNNDWEVVKGAHVKAKAKEKTKGKRKPGYSLVNPTVKRYAQSDWDSSLPNSLALCVRKPNGFLILNSLFFFRGISQRERNWESRPRSR